jgi:hypothetical protein
LLFQKSAVCNKYKEILKILRLQHGNEKTAAQAGMIYDRAEYIYTAFPTFCELL